jgi:hypothetical protein
VSAAYKLETSRTADQTAPIPGISLAAPGMISEGGFALENVQSLFSNSTSFADSTVTLGDPLQAGLKQQVDRVARAPFGKGQVAASWWPSEHANLSWYPAKLRHVIPLSSATKPLLIIAVGIKALASKEADDLLASARAAARSNDMRTAYDKLFRGLDIVLRIAKWQQVSLELEEMSSEQYPVAFGIGAVRFASDAASRIPNWNLILRNAAGV